MNTIERWFNQKERNLLMCLIWEVFCTLSNRPSFFASKRIERFIMFMVAIWIIIGYTIRNWTELDVYAVMELSGMLLFGAAMNAVQIRKDMREIPNNSNINSATSNNDNPPV